jgi:hypothetical protein
MQEPLNVTAADLYAYRAYRVSAVMQKSSPKVIQNSPPVALLRRRSEDDRSEQRL